MKREVFKSYRELLRDPRWIERRNELISERGCCFYHDQAGRNQDEGLLVHHKTYRRNTMPWEYTDDELVVVCQDCHDRIHIFADESWDLLLRLDPESVGAVRDALQELVKARHADERMISERLRHFVRRERDDKYRPNLVVMNSLEAVEQWQAELRAEIQSRPKGYPI